MSTRLKSLELQGYKTFANRTVFEYADSITVIVGPNGSGKSNIADSIRWVLGEQSYSLLRGKKTEDMIFSGSEQRPRAGMASATMLFDNNDGWLPIDFSEVAITRRAYRDGQNEYLINGSRVRLKDVSELLANSGLAERTYTVIGQGLVDAALSLKAEERRDLFEEAAGIGLFRGRREEAIRRLDITKRNLERVQDILTELQPRLRSLEKQARRAQEYEQLRNHLRGLLKEWYGYHWNQAQIELSEARRITKMREDALNQVIGQQAILDEQSVKIKDRINILRLNLNPWHNQLGEISSSREALGREEVATEERIRSLYEQKHSSEDEIRRLEEELALHQESIIISSQELETLEAKLYEAREQYNKAKQVLDIRKSEREASESIIEGIKWDLSKLLARKSELSIIKNERTAYIERLKLTLANLEEAIKTSDLEFVKKQVLLDHAALDHQQIEKKLNSAEEHLSIQQSKIVEFEKQRQEIISKRTDACAELARLQTQFEILDQAEENLFGYSEGAKILLEASRQSQLKGLQGMLGKLLKIPPELEIAITAVLGEYIDAIILESPTSVEEALNLLLGKAVSGIILPIDSMKSNQASSPLKDNSDILGIASEMISIRKKFRPILNTLLGQVVVVKDRVTARRVLSEVQEGSRVVTLQGELFDKRGPIRVGWRKKPDRLSRSLQLKEIQAKINKCEKQILRFNLRLENVEQELFKHQMEKDQNDLQLQAARKTSEATTNEINQLKNDIIQMEQFHLIRVEQQNSIETEIQGLIGELNQIDSEILKLDTDIPSFRLQLDEQEKQLAEANLDEYWTEYNHFHALVLVAERGVSDGVTHQTEIKDIFSRINSHITEARSRLNEMESSIQKYDTLKIEHQQRETAINDQIEELNHNIKHTEVELESDEKELINLQETEITTRQRYSIQEQHYSQARITQARQQERLEALQRRIEDDFGLVSFEYSDDVSGQEPLPMDGIVEKLPVIHQIPPELEQNINHQRAQLRRMGSINLDAQVEYNEVNERFQFMKEQTTDLEKAKADIYHLLDELDEIMQKEFRKTFAAVAGEFSSIFERLFGGGSARLVLTNPNNLSETGIDIEARLPGKRTQGLSLLSGGERSLTATALVFALLKISPTPFCVLDEVDAMLDETNVERFNDLLRELSADTQFIVVTHNRNTVQVADVIYGVTMGRDSVSQVISLKLDEVDNILRT